MYALTGVTNTTLTGPYENQIGVYHSGGLVWATVEQWCSVLKAPYFLPEVLKTSAETQSSLLRGGPYKAVFASVTAYRWPPIAAALDLWHRNWMVAVSKGDHTKMPLSLRHESEQFAKNVARLKAWGYELQERELQAAMNSQTTTQSTSSGLVDISHAIEAIKSLAQATQIVLEKHESQISNHEVQIEEMKRGLPAFRAPDAFVTIKQRFLERALSFGTVVQGRMNLSQACGQYLQKSGAEKGQSLPERIDGTAVIKDVATWRREDIDAAIKHYVPDLDLLHLPEKRN